MYDEDYCGGEDCVYYKNVVDFVILNVYISYILINKNSMSYNTS